jgi:hypothetical protein
MAVMITTPVSRRATSEPQAMAIIFISFMVKFRAKFGVMFRAMFRAKSQR